MLHLSVRTMQLGYLVLLFVFDVKLMLLVYLWVQTVLTLLYVFTSVWYIIIVIIIVTIVVLMGNLWYFFAVNKSKFLNLFFNLFWLF